jgi:hypothetical protein
VVCDVLGLDAFAIALLLVCAMLSVEIQQKDNTIKNVCMFICATIFF